MHRLYGNYVTEVMTDTGMSVQFHCTAVMHKEKGKVNLIKKMSRFKVRKVISARDVVETRVVCQSLELGLRSTAMLGETTYC